MNRVQERASLHETTVQKIASGEVTPRRRRRRNVTTPPVVNAWETKLEKMVHAAVLASGAPASHCQYFPDGSVIIWNHPAPWPVVQ